MEIVEYFKIYYILTINFFRNGSLRGQIYIINTMLIFKRNLPVGFSVVLRYIYITLKSKTSLTQYFHLFLKESRDRNEFVDAKPYYLNRFK